MARRKHSKKEVEEAICYAESMGWTVELRSGHCWARIFCPHHVEEKHRMSVYSTPRDAQDHAKDIKRIVDKCNRQR
jgi:hypothetical protein